MERRSFLKTLAAAIAGIGLAPNSIIEGVDGWQHTNKIIRKEVAFTGRHIQSLMAAPNFDIDVAEAIARATDEAKHEAEIRGWAIKNTRILWNTQPIDMDAVQHSLIFEC